MDASSPGWAEMACLLVEVHDAETGADTKS